MNVQTLVRKKEVDDGIGVTWMLINRVSFTVGTFSMLSSPSIILDKLI